MTEPILDPLYWKRRLEEAERLHHAIFRCPLDQWQRIERKHRAILATHIQPTDSIFDAGCAWGRLLSLLPVNWKGDYLGMDISPDFIALAHVKYADRLFVQGDLRYLVPTKEGQRYDWAILISIRPMISRNLGEEAWSEVESRLVSTAKKILFLEYDENNEGEVLCGR